MTAQRVPRVTRTIRALLIPMVAAALVVMPGLGVAPTQNADSAARLSVTSSAGTNQAAASGATNVNVAGSGFQSINNGFGGIYVVFGYVKNSNWQPSKGGKGGKDFFYVADSQSKNNKGYQRFVAFPGSSTADSANGGVIGADGSFKLSMVIPGPTFTATTSSGSSTQIDCREVQCGIITFGAHGVVNGKNEAFQPISFAATGATNKANSTQQNNSTNQTTTDSTAPGTPTENTNAPQEATADPTTNESSVAAGPREAHTTGDPTLGLEQQTVIAGRNLGFTGRGFAAGEQVVATLSSGLTAAGPIIAGQFGEIAGAVQIPADMTAGTHKIKLTGAGSAASVETEFSVMADAALIAENTSTNQEGIRWAMIAVIVTAALLFILVLSSLITALVRKDGKSKKTTSAKSKVKRSSAARKRRRPAGRSAKRKSTASKTVEAQTEETSSDMDTTNLDQLEDVFHRERV